MDKTRYIIYIPTSGETELIQVDGTDGREPSVRQLEDLTGRYIECAESKHGALVASSESYTNAEPVNALATRLMHPKSKDCIRGDAVLCAESGNHLVGFTYERAQRIADGLSEGREMTKGET